MIELGLIGSAWHGTDLSVVEGIRKTKEIGFEAYDVFEDPLTISADEQRLIKETCAEVGLPIRDLQVFSKEQIFGLVVENVRELAEYVADRGIEVAIELEPFANAVASSVHELAQLIRDVDHPNAKANADVSHLQLSGASFDDVNVLAGMIGHVHVSDCDGRVHGDMPPGRGVTPIKEYLQAIVDTGFDGTVALEFTRNPERMLELVEEAYRETARILAEIGARDPAAWQPVSST